MPALWLTSIPPNEGIDRSRQRRVAVIQSTKSCRSTPSVRHNGLLDLSKLSVGNYVVDRQVLALDRLVAEVCTEFHTAAKERGLNFSQWLTPVWVRTDANAVARIAPVLIDNGIKYTGSGTFATAAKGSA